MSNKWADLLQCNDKYLGEKGARALRNWIRQAVATNMPYDKFVYAVLTASGSNIENPPASYYKILREPGPLMENTTQLFLGVRFNCNKCHDHPFERWTQNQHWQLAAFFAKVDRKDDPHYADKKIGGTDVEAGKALGEVIYDGTTGRSPQSDDASPTDARLPLHLPRHGPAHRHAPRAIRPLDHLAEESVFRQELRESDLELSDGRRLHRADRRHSRRQSADQSRVARSPDGRFHRQRLRRAEVAAADLQIGHVSTFARHQ